MWAPKQNLPQQSHSRRIAKFCWLICLIRLTTEMGTKASTRQKSQTNVKTHKYWFKAIWLPTRTSSIRGTKILEQWIKVAREIIPKTPPKRTHTRTFMKSNLLSKRTTVSMQNGASTCNILLIKKIKDPKILSIQVFPTISRIWTSKDPFKGTITRTSRCISKMGADSVKCESMESWVRLRRNNLKVIEK